ncbi:MAG: hypothetical protein M1839_002210 [Geoglossum umbratile]|nr:MAG: hypothetical protein M1839_002210 [Geoglossum umbratile]
MPEIGEVAKLVHQLRKHLVGKTISSIRAVEDTIVFKDTTSELFENAIVQKTVTGAGQQGKYFWITMSSSPHIVAHLGMTGWMSFSNEDLGFYKAKKEDNEWPPKYWKFLLSTAEDPKCEIAFTDPRRLGRIRLVDCEASQIRNHSPLKENGPDPVVDKEKLSKDWFTERIKRKKVPVKAWLLDQANVSGVGNWVGDEILYNAKIHPEQYTNSLTDTQLDQLHKSVLSVCSIAVETLADQERFPEEWLMKYRWSKGKKDKKLPNGQKIEFVKVGGRTSAFVPTVQKKTGPAADEATDSTKKTTEMNGDESVTNDSKLAKRRAAAPVTKKPAPKKTGRGRGKAGGEDEGDASGAENEEEEDSTDDKELEHSPKRRKTSADKPSKNTSEKKQLPLKPMMKSRSTMGRKDGNKQRK